MGVLLVTACIVIADREGVFPSSNLQIENSAINEKGWYIYGAKNGDGTFVVQAIAPYHLLSLSLDRVMFYSFASSISKVCFYFFALVSQTSISK